MKVVIFAGGLGTRLGEQTQYKPKPLIEVGGKPILWHIMKTYSYYGYNDFIICGGYKVEMIKDYFCNYNNRNLDFTINLANMKKEYYNSHQEEKWNVTIVDTGYSTLKGGRVKRIEKYLDDDINLLTYGDGVCDVDIKDVVKFHKENNSVVTVTGVHPAARFGEIIHKGGKVVEFEEKPQTSRGLINGGYMVFNKELLNYLTADEDCDLEFGAFEQLAKAGKMAVYEHEGNWQCMDHGRDVKLLNEYWEKGNAFWKVW